VAVGVVLAVACQNAATNEASGPPSAAAVAARLDRIAEACAKLGSCAHAHDPPRLRDESACVDWWLSHVTSDASPFAGCIAAARTCAAVDACARERGDAAATAFCRAHPGTPAGCDGARLVTCAEDDPAESTALDCASMGASCGEVSQSDGLIARACVSSSLCPAGAPEARCDGAGAIVSCHEGAVERTFCAPGSRCQEQKAPDGTSAALCEPPAHRHCDALGKRWCEGARLVQCQPHGPLGQPLVTDCAALGLECDAHARPAAACVLPGAGTCSQPGRKCDGEALTFCAANRAFHVSCGALGFGACDPDAHGVDAACAQPVSGAAPPRP
jgi:hypothetical protein